MSRREKIIAVILTLALLSFLLFSIILAIRPVPAPPTPTVITAIVPNLVGEDDSTAQTDAENAGFKLQLANVQTSTDGVVAKQSPTAGVSYAKGSTIEVTMGPKQVSVIS